MIEKIPYPGEIMALTTAIVWASAVILFKKSGETVHPIGLNLFKNVLAFALIIPTMWIMGKTMLRPVPAWHYLFIIFSGALGIGISDTLFFKSLNLLGAGLSAIVDCLYSPFIIGLSILWLGERLTALQVIGAAMIISAVLTITVKGGAGGISQRDLLWGVFYGAAAMAVMAVSIVMIKPMLETSPLLWIMELRLLGGILPLIAVLIFHPRRRRICASIWSQQGRVYTLTGSFIGGYLALLLWLGGMKFTQASIAAALNQTSNIFVFIFAGIFLKELIDKKRIAGIVLGVGGVFMVMFERIVDF